MLASSSAKINVFWLILSQFLAKTSSSFCGLIAKTHTSIILIILLGFNSTRPFLERFISQSEGRGSRTISGGEFQSNTPYMYSTYDTFILGNADCESNPTNSEKVIIIGSGPNRIGQGIEKSLAFSFSNIIQDFPNFLIIINNPYSRVILSSGNRIRLLLLSCQLRPFKSGDWDHYDQL